MSETGTHRLRQLRLKRVSLVSDPASEPSRVVLFKSAEPKRPQEQPVKKDDMDTVTCSKCQKAVSRKADGTCPNCGAKLTGATKMNKGIDLDKITDPEVRKAVEKMAADLEAAEALAAEEQEKRIAAEKKAKATDLRPADDVLKGLTPEARAVVEKAQADAAAARSDAKAATDAILKMQDERREAVFVTKARTYTNLSVDAGKFGPLLKRVADGTSTEKDVDEIHRVLTGANSIAKTLFGQKGSSSAGEGSGNTSAFQQIEAKAKELRESVLKSGDKISHADALSRVMKESPELYQQHLQEFSRKVRVAAEGGALADKEEE